MIVAIDFETYYDVDYTLRKCSTSEYIRHELFKTHMMGFKVDQEPTKVYAPDDIPAALASIDWTRADLLCHHTAFDGFILQHHYGVVPRRYLCTLSMARGQIPGLESYSLDSLAGKFGLGGKLANRLEDTKGKRELTPEEFKALAEYCMVDTELNRRLYDIMAPAFPESELALIDLTLRMFCEPVIEVDQAVAEEELEAELGGKVAALLQSGVSASRLMSNEQFAELLRDQGVAPPVKLSKTTNLPTHAFAKNDADFRALLRHPSETVRNIVEARLKIKSTIGETRARRLLEEAKDGPLPVYLNYYGAHTGRWSGGNKMNLQNLPRGSRLRRSLTAPAGHVLAVADSAQIEARVTAWLAKQPELVTAFADGRDVYSEFASKIYERPITKADKLERFVGKTCLANGTLILSDRGWIPIETLSTQSRIWDGKEWVCHKGVTCNGSKETLQLSGLWLTPDHLVWSGAQWLEAQRLEHDAGTLSRALVYAAENLPSPAILPANGVGLLRSSSCAPVAPSNIPSTARALRTSTAPDARFAPAMRGAISDTGATLKQWLTTHIGRVSSTGLAQLLRAAVREAIAGSPTTAAEGYLCTQVGSRIGPHFFATCKPYQAGTSRHSKWTESMSTATTNRGTSDSSLAEKISKINARSRSCRRKLTVYDVLSAGPRNRFTVWTDSGPLIVHNCILGLGFGMGPQRLRETLANGSPSVSMPHYECIKVVRLYRETYDRIPELWEQMQVALSQMLKGGRGGEYECLKWSPSRIRLPNGMFLLYNGLHSDKDSGEYFYMSGRTLSKIYGGLLTENVVQALARVIIAEQMLVIAKRYRIVLMAHDEIVAVAPKSEADDALAFMLKTMSTPPSWAPDLPLAAEGGYDVCYSK